MDFFILLVLNIFIGAIIFLVLSLKIEKTSSTFQEKKLRKEMSEIITEFNATAERNITLLENRISVLKKLLIENGSLKRVDFTIFDDKMKDNSDKNDLLYKQNENKIDKKDRDIDDSDDQFNISMDRIKLKDIFKDDFHVDNVSVFKNNDKKNSRKLSDLKKDDEIFNEKFAIVENSGFTEKNNIDLLSDEEMILNYQDEQSDDLIDIEELFKKTDDKYALIASLFAEGHSIEELSKYSGIPSGEIKLVISLNS
jgi:hypothetical protein